MGKLTLVFVTHKIYSLTWEDSLTLMKLLINTANRTWFINTQQYMPLLNS